jgi:hypothetical protein
MIHPIFIHGDKVAINTMSSKPNGLPFRLDYESLFCQFGFILPTSVDSLSIPRALSLRMSAMNGLSATAILVTKSGELYEVATNITDGKRDVIVRLINPGTQLFYRSFTTDVEEQMELCYMNGCRTPEEILRLLGSKTILDIRGYQQFSLKAIVADLQTRATIDNPEYYLLEKEAGTKA